MNIATVYYMDAIILLIQYVEYRGIKAQFDRNVLPGFAFLP